METVFLQTSFLAVPHSEASFETNSLREFPQDERPLSNGVFVYFKGHNLRYLLRLDVFYNKIQLLVDMKGTILC